MIAGDHHAGAVMSPTSPRQTPARKSCCWLAQPGGHSYYRPRLPSSATLHMQFNLSSPHRQPMVRPRASRTWRALDYVQPAHLAGVGIAPLGEISDVTREAGESRVQKIGVERNDYVRFREVILRLHRLAEGQLCAFEHIVAVDRLVHMPLGLRISLDKRLQLVGQRGRGNRRRQDADARSLQVLSEYSRGPRMASTSDSPGANVAQVSSRSANGRGHTFPGSRPGRRYRCRPGSRDAGRCLQSWWDDTGGSRPESGWRTRPG